jgi:hypothetical protein
VQYYKHTQLFINTVQNRNLTCRWWVTCREGISNESRITSTHGAVALDGATSMDSAYSGTRVFTFVSDASKIDGTVGIDGTFWLALNIGIALEPWETSARGCSLSVSTFSIDTTGRWTARVNNFRSGRCCCAKKKIRFADDVCEFSHDYCWVTIALCLELFPVTNHL